MAGRLRELDWLRGYGVVLAASLHVLYLLAAGSHLTRFANARLYLQGGVDIFFAISGFVISRVLHRFWTRQVEDAPQELAAFWVRRFLRLWPALALWVGVCLAGALVWPRAWPPRMPERMAAAAVYATNWFERGNNSGLGYFWSLAVEWQFYLVLPLFLLLVRPTAARLVPLLAIFLLGVFWRPFGPDWWMFRVDALIAGILVFMMQDRLVRLSARLFPTAGKALALVLVALIVGSLSITPWRWSFQALAAACSGGLVLLGLHGRGYIPAFGAPRVMDWLGARSYSIYLCHIPVMIGLVSLAELALGRHRTAADAPWLAPLALVLIGLAAEASYRWVERPSHAAGRRIGALVERSS